MNCQFRLRPVRRPETGAGDVRQNVVVVGWHLWNQVNCLRAVGTAQETVPGVVERRTFFQVVRPIGDSYGIPGAAVSFDRVLINGGVNHTQIVEDTAGLGTFTGAEESGHGDRGQERDNRDNDHDFHEGEAPAAIIKFIKHCVKLLSVL